VGNPSHQGGLARGGRHRQSHLRIFLENRGNGKHCDVITFSAIWAGPPCPLQGGSNSAPGGVGRMSTWPPAGVRPWRVRRGAVRPSRRPARRASPGRRADRWPKGNPMSLARRQAAHAARLARMTRTGHQGLIFEYLSILSTHHIVLAGPSARPGRPRDGQGPQAGCDRDRGPDADREGRGDVGTGRPPRSFTRARRVAANERKESRAARSY